MALFLPFSFIIHGMDRLPMPTKVSGLDTSVITPLSFPFVRPSQEEKYKYYYNQLTHLVREYEGVVGRLEPTIKPLLRPHLEDMERKVAPGFSLLTWTSMNVDGYLHRFKQVCMGGD